MKHKNAQIRYNALDECFRSTVRDFNINMLLEVCNTKLIELGYEGIQKRQLYDDIKYMKSQDGWMIELEHVKNGRERIYRYVDTNFSITKAAELNVDQKEFIKEALLSLKTMSGIPQLDLLDLDTICSQLKIGLEDKDVRDEVYLKEYNESYRDFSGGVHLEKIFGLIRNKKNVQISYKDKENQLKEVIVSPYLLKEYNSRWYLLGQSKAFDNPTLTPLDRIQELVEDSSEYIKKPKTITKDYFNDVVGVTVNKEDKEEVVLKINHDIWNIIESRPIHESQRTPEFKDGYVYVRYKLIPNKELENKILHWGENITVIAPEKLKEKIQERITKMTRNYNSAH